MKKRLHPHPLAVVGRRAGEAAAPGRAARWAAQRKDVTAPWGEEREAEI